MQNFTEMFEQGAGHKPYAYQVRLAGEVKLPQVFNAPTGSGKTAAAFFTWYWRRRCHPDSEVRKATPRRLVYCLPMRVLVEQTSTAIRGFLEALRPEPEINVHVLMGGDYDDDWQLHPERDVVIIGTQDMLLSRALNRGYAMSRFRWPIPFALLNNDVFWVLDELQLMGPGMPTAGQLAAFRDKLKTFGPATTMWMSATVSPEWLKTHDYTIEEEPFKLNRAEMDEPRLKCRLEAVKSLARLATKNGASTKGYPKELAGLIAEQHQAGRQTLVILNTVNRARDTYLALMKNLSKIKNKQDRPDVMLLHSRFRPPDRKALVEKLVGPIPDDGPGRIVISTQVVEAGLDISAALLISEIAPWSSMVQRFGRCNRFGEWQDARVFYVDPGPRAEAPYETEALVQSRELLEALEDSSVSPVCLPAAGERSDRYQVLRKKDLLELFDTAPDLSGNDVDVSRFIRDADETGLFLCWRRWAGPQPPPAEEPKPAREELCPAPIMELSDLISSGEKRIYLWDYADRRWRTALRRDLFPGRIFVIHADAGCYSPETGWDPGNKAPVELPFSPASPPEESGGDDRFTFAGRWQTLREHSEDTLQVLRALLAKLPYLDLEPFRTPLHEAALWHDLGKAHQVFQNTLLNSLEDDERNSRMFELWAKAPVAPGRRHLHERPHFRHELATLLALLAQEEVPCDLTLYLAASHHGKVRLAIRSLPGNDGHSRLARDPNIVLGIREGDTLPACDLGTARSAPCTLTLDAAALGSANGSPSWLSRTLTLLDIYGPFRLAFLEMILRTSDVRASILSGRGKS